MQLLTLFSLQKTLALLAMPAGFLWLLLLLACLFCFRRRQKALGVFLLAIALLYACAGSIHFGALLTARLESPIHPVDPAVAGPFEAVFVLGGGSDEDPSGRPELGSSGDRIRLAASLWHLGRTRLLVASGMSRDSLRGVRNDGAETRRLWRELGVPDSAILVVNAPCWVTRDEIAAYRSLQARHGWKRMALVSSATHLPRALALARRVGLEVTPLGADWRGRPRAFQFQDLVPRAEGFLDVQRACWEYLGRWVGR
jgi:uncharacterized SAM-binding protein YcdF (DUF218 family)